LRFVVCNSIDLLRPEVALEGSRYSGEWNVEVRRYAITELSEHVGKFLSSPIVGEVARRAGGGCEYRVTSPSASLRSAPPPRWGRKNSYSGVSQLSPGKQLSWIHLAGGGYVGMAHDTICRNGMAREDGVREFQERIDLRCGKRDIAEFVSGIDEFDSDRAAVHIALAGPPRNSGVPRAPAFVDVAIDTAIAIDRVMRRYFRFGIAQPVERLFGRAHARVVQDEHIDCRARRPRVMIGRGTLDEMQVHRFAAYSAPTRRSRMILS
jgi:hypothetical protein